MTSSSQDTSSATTTTRFEDLLSGLIGSLIDDRGALRIETEAGDAGTTFRVFVRPDDMGKVVGKQGRTVRAIRTVLNAVASKSNQRFALDVLEDDSDA